MCVCVRALCAFYMPCIKIPVILLICFLLHHSTEEQIKNRLTIRTTTLRVVLFLARLTHPCVTVERRRCVGKLQRCFWFLFLFILKSFLLSPFPEDVIGNSSLISKLLKKTLRGQTVNGAKRNTTLRNPLTLLERWNWMALPWICSVIWTTYGQSTSYTLFFSFM